MLWQCWSKEHHKRPSFTSILKYLDQGVKTGSFWGDQKPKVEESGPSLEQKLAQCANLLEGPGEQSERVEYNEGEANEATNGRS